MYYVNREQIEIRLHYFPRVVQALNELSKEEEQENPLFTMALERAVHLAIELVTDIGSLLIDGFLMRDASSYEDIIEILRGEEVFPAWLAAPLSELVMWRKPLVQDYTQVDHNKLRTLAGALPKVLVTFSDAVQAYLGKELDTP